MNRLYDTNEITGDEHNIKFFKQIKIDSNKINETNLLDFIKKFIDAADFYVEGEKHIEIMKEYLVNNEDI